jgi:hypothetical protein
MPKLLTVAVTGDDLLAHPALRAWRQLCPDRLDLGRLRLLQRRDESRSFRLEGAGPDGSAVFVKWRPRPVAELERAIYQEILAPLPVTSLRCYGFVEDPGAGAGWLFLEDFGGQKYSPQNAEHQALAVRWLGVMQTHAEGAPAGARLPEQGPGCYLGELRAAAAMIRQCIPNPALTSADRAELTALLRQLDLLEARWGRVEAACADMPRTLVHGDFARKNLGLRTTPTGPELLPFDWETGGWGVPAADIALVDAAAYWSVVRNRWGGLGLRGIERLAELGRVFRLLAGIRWVSLSLASAWVGKPMGQMRYYLNHLSAALLAEGWAA